MKTQSLDYDIIISGAGPAGLSFAAAFQDSDLRIALVDPSPKKALQKPAYDGRETALTHLSETILKELGVFDNIPENSRSQMKRAHVVNGDEAYALRFDHTEAGAEYLGTMVSNHAIRAALYKTVSKQKNVDVVAGRSVEDIEVQGALSVVTLDNGKAISAKLVIGADGRRSPTRAMFNIPTKVKNLQRTCLVGVMTHSEAHNDTAFECFHYERTLAVLPLKNGRVSIVITLPSDEAQPLMDMSPDEFAHDIETRFEKRVGTMAMDGKLHAYPLILNYASQFYAERFAVLGDAAVGMHPVTAHGFNLGLRGGHTLATEIKRAVEVGGDIGSPLVLRAYNRQHQIICRPLYMGTNIVERLFTNETKPAKLARKALLRLGNLVKPANKLIMNQLTEKRA